MLRENDELDDVAGAAFCEVNANACRLGDMIDRECGAARTVACVLCPQRGQGLALWTLTISIKDKSDTKRELVIIVQ